MPTPALRGYSSELMSPSTKASTTPSACCACLDEGNPVDVAPDHAKKRRVTPPHIVDACALQTTPPHLGANLYKSLQARSV